MEYRIHVADHCHTDDNQDKRKYFFTQKYMEKVLSLTYCKADDGNDCLWEQTVGCISLCFSQLFKLQKYAANFAASLRRYVKPQEVINFTTKLFLELKGTLVLQQQIRFLISKKLKNLA
jgi:hypothetical protein